MKDWDMVRTTGEYVKIDPLV